MRTPAIYNHPTDLPDAEAPDELVVESGEEKFMLSDSYRLVQQIRELDPSWTPDLHGVTFTDAPTPPLEPAAHQHHSVPTAETPAAAVAAAIAAATPAAAADVPMLLNGVGYELPKSASIRKLRAEVEAQRKILNNYAVRLEAAHIAVTAARS